MYRYEELLKECFVVISTEKCDVHWNILRYSIGKMRVHEQTWLCHLQACFKCVLGFLHSGVNESSRDHTRYCQ